MENLFKKFIYTGVGMVSMTTDRVQSMIDDLIKERKISSEEGKKIVNDFLKNTENRKEDFESQFSDAVEDTIGKFKLATKEDIDELESRLSALESQSKK